MHSKPGKSKGLLDILIWYMPVCSYARILKFHSRTKQNPCFELKRGNMSFVWSIKNLTSTYSRDSLICSVCVMVANILFL